MNNFTVILAKNLTDDQFRGADFAPMLDRWIETHQPTKEAEVLVTRQKLYKVARQMHLAIVEAGSSWECVEPMKGETCFCRRGEHAEIEFVTFPSGKEFPGFWQSHVSRDWHEVVYVPGLRGLRGQYAGKTTKLEIEFAEMVVGSHVHVPLEEPVLAIFPPSWIGQGYPPTVCLLSEYHDMTLAFAASILSAEEDLKDKLVAEQTQIDERKRDLQAVDRRKAKIRNR